MKIKFNVDRNVLAQGVIAQEFKAGEVYELSASSARRWIRRGLAEEVRGSVKPAPTKSKPVAEPVPAKAGGQKPEEVKSKPIASTEAAS